MSNNKLGMNGKITSRGTRLGPLSRHSGQITFSEEEIKEIGCIILESVKEEIKKDMAKTSAIRNPGEPVPIPNSKRFVESFKWKLKGKKTLEIYSNWPTAAAHTVEKQKGPFNMVWLKAPSVPYARLDLKGGISIVRTTPGGNDFWIHPGFKKYNFLERGVRKGQIKAIEKMTQIYLKKLLTEYDITK